MSRVQSSSSASSVSIKDTNGNELTSSSGALNVNVVSTGEQGTTISVYNEVTNVAMNGNATIISYTVPTGMTLNLSRVDTSSDSIGTVQLNLNGTVNGKQRYTYTNFNLSFEYDNFAIVAGTIISLIATNSSLQGVASFNATLQGVLSS